MLFVVRTLYASLSATSPAPLIMMPFTSIGPQTRPEYYKLTRMHLTGAL